MAILNDIKMFFVCATGIMLTTSSCEKFVEIAPIDKITTDVAFFDSLNATASVVGIYTDVLLDPSLGKLLHGGMTVTTALAGDELVANAASADVTQFYKNAISPTNNWNTGYLWRSGYQIIYKTNACIEGLTRATGISSNLKEKLLAEVKFVRAFTYFNLVNLYGDVPYIKSTDYKINSQAERTPISQILNDIKKELEEARSALPYSYPSNGKQRPNKAAIHALLARLYLQQAEWQALENESTRILDLGTYSLVGDLDKVFLPGNSEAIWQMDPIVKGSETADGLQFIPSGSTSIPRYTLSNILLQAFENGDKRLEKWVGKNSVTRNGITKEYFYPKKYKLSRDNWVDKPIESYSYFRLAETYLLRAEARLNLGKIDGPGSAMEDINTIRRRASLTDTSTTNIDEARSILRRERQIELFCEWGMRWFDLKRRSDVDDYMTVVAATKGTTWNSNWKLFPVPVSEIRLNTKLSQNAGYPN